jgi:hypothetical protein
VRIAIIGLAALASLWLAIWARGPGTAASETLDSADMSGDLATRIGLAASMTPGPSTAGEIAAMPQISDAAAQAPAPVRHDRETARQVWGRPAEFAPPE